MRGKGITYDTGFISEGMSTHEPFALEIVKREMRIIRDDLHCNAVRITGGYPDRLEIAATYAADAGLEIWFSPFTNDLTTDHLLDLLADCAERAERLRRRGAEVVFVTGAGVAGGLAADTQDPPTTIPAVPPKRPDSALITHALPAGAAASAEAVQRSAAAATRAISVRRTRSRITALP